MHGAAPEKEMAVESFSMLARANAAPWFVGWGTLALINAGLAQGKNRSGLAWFVLSLLAGPFATLVIVLLPKVRNRIF